MIQNLHILLVFTLCALWQANLLAQNHLNVAYLDLNSIPNFLNVCGSEDEIILEISLEGTSPDIRNNIEATVHLFEGVELVNFNPALSSVGITLSNNSDPTQPIFQIPDLQPSATTAVNVAFSIRANCNYVDTLLQNDQLQVFDVWEFNYDLGSSSNLSEFDQTAEYRDAFAIPFFTVDVVNNNPPAKVGDCFTRSIQVSNSALDGYVSSLIYNNVQGAGIWVTNIEVNGLPAVATKTLDLNADTLISTELTSLFFQNNQFGNGDDFFDPNESMTIVETFCVQDCDAYTGSDHSVAWGCGGAICREMFAPDFVNIGEGEANVNFATSGSIPNVNAGYCVSGQSTVTITNNGVEFDAGFATMFNVEAGIGLGSNFLLENAGYVITGVQVAGIDINNFDALNLLEGNAQFGTDPDGIGGLIDADNDGFFDDLALNESFEITVFYDFDCTGAASFDENSNCVNDFSSSFHARIDYDDACGNRLVRTRNNYFRPANNNSFFENTADPDAFVENGVFYVTHQESRTVRFFDFDCNGEEIFVVKVVIPQGISPVLAEIELLKNDLVTVPLLSNALSNDTLILTYDASFSPFLNGEYTIQLAFEANCTANLGATSFPTTFEFICPPCDCQHLWFCGDLSGPQLHATVPPCQPNQVLTCDRGIQTTQFEVNRTTFGFQDAQFTQPFPPQNANQKVAIGCDSVQMRVLNIVGDTPISDSIGVVITYSNPDESNVASEVFLFDEGLVRFVNNGVEFICPISVDILDVQTDTSFKKLTFDLNDCLVNLGLTLEVGDTIEFLGNFSVNPNGPYSVQFKKVPDFRAYGFAIIEGGTATCDNFGETFTLAKNRIAFDFPNSTNFPQGCEFTPLQYRLITVNNGFSDFFGNELRGASRVDSLVFDFDPALLDAFDLASVEVSIPGHPVFGNDFFSLAPLTDFPNGHYAALFDTLTTVPTLNEVQTYTFNLRINLLPSCRSEVGSSNGNNQYGLNAKIYYNDRYYALAIGDGSCMEVKVDSIASSIDYDAAPTFSLQPQSNTNFVVASDTAEWIVQHCNTSFVSDAGLTWIALEDSTATIQVLSIEDISDPSNPTLLDIENYGTNGTHTFAFTAPLLKADGVNGLEDICNFIRIKAIVNQCLDESFTLRTGWNCTNFVEANWTPDLYPPCEEENFVLSISILDPFLDANLVDQPAQNPNICDTSSITILLRNTDLGTLFDLRTQLILPLQGASLLPNSVQVAYPSGADFEPALGSPTLVGMGLQGQIFQYDDFSNLNNYLNINGLQGFAPSSPTDSNELKIKFSFVTDCNFRSGELVFYNFQGFKGCGSASNFEAGESFPFIINGAEPDLSNLFEVAFGMQSNVLPSTLSQLQIHATNLSNTPTDLNNFVSLSLPQGFNYEFNSSTASAPATWQIGEPEIEVQAGFEILTWQLPAGLVLNETATFQFQVNTPIFNCDSDIFQVPLSTVSQTQLFCESSNADCTVETLTSTTGANLTSLPVGGTVMPQFESSTSICENNGQETVTFSGNLTSVVNVPVDNYLLEIFQDANGNDSIDVNDLKLHEITLNGAIAPSSPLPFLTTFTTDGSNICQLLAQLTATNTDLCGEVILPISTPTLSTAGNDQVVCAKSDTTAFLSIGNSLCANQNYTYLWTALPPASLADLSNINIANPDLTLSHTGNLQDTLTYILETNRPNCTESIFDTVQIIRAIDVTIAANAPIILFPTLDTTLIPNITTGTPPFSYQWQPENTLDNSTSPSPIASPTDNTDYFVTVTDASGCSEIGLFEVKIVEPVVANASPADTSVCAGMSIQIMSSGGDNFEWLENPANPTAGNLSAYDIPNPLFTEGVGNGIYLYELVTWFNNFPDFRDTAQVFITVFENPQVDAGQDLEICPGNSAQWTAQANGGNGNLTFEWSPEPFAGQGTLSPTASPLVTTTYILTATDDNGCVGRDSVMITVFENPIVDAGQDTSFCMGDSIQLNAQVSGTGQLTLEWSPSVLSGQGTITPFVNPVQSTIYTLTVTDQNGCHEIDSILVTVFEMPTVNAGQDTSLCAGDSIQLNAQISGTGNLTLEWSPQVLSGQGTTTPFVNPDQSTTYVLTVTHEDGCSAVDSVSVTVFEMPTVNVGQDTSLCIGDSIQLNAQISGSGQLTLEWTPQVLNGQGTATPFINPDQSTTYVLTVTHEDGCSAVASVFVEVFENPIVEAGTSVNICAGDSIQLNAQANGGTGNLTLQWSPDVLIGQGTLTPRVFPNLTTTYFLFATDENGCVAFDSVIVTVFDNPTVDAGQDTSICLGEQVQLNAQVANGSGNYIFTWQPEPLSGQGTLTPTFQPDGTTNYVLTVLDDNGCEAKDTIQILTFIPPTVDAGQDSTICLGQQIELSAQVAGGSGNYTFEWSPQVLFGQGTATPMVLPSETTTYQLTVFDGNNCVATDGVVVSVEVCQSCSPAIVNNISTSPANCGMADGAAFVEVEGAVNDFIFNWVPDVGTPSGGNNNRINLPFGGYEVLIQNVDDTTCFTQVSILIENETGPQAIATTTNATCQATTGSAVLQPATFEYLWEDGSNALSRNDLAVGSYFVTVTDPNNATCENVLVLEIGEDNPLSAILVIDEFPSCGLANGTATIAVSGGSGTYNFSWPSGIATQDGLAAGIYNITITDTDATMCELPFTFVLPDSVPQATVEITDTLHLSCFGAMDGAVTFDIQFDNNVAMPLDTIYSNGFQFFENGNLPVGQICVQISDANGCVAGGACFEILQPAPILVELSPTLACGDGGEILINVQGGTPPYQFDWQDLIGNNDPANRINLVEGMYQVTVTDQNGCSSIASAIVEACDCVPPTVTSILTTEATCGFGNGSATLQIDGDESDYIFNWTPALGVSNALGNARIDLFAGLYLVEIISKIDSTCLTTTDVLILNENGPTAMVTTNSATCAAMNGSATFTPANFDYVWPDGDTAAVRDDLAAGSYVVTFTNPANPICENVILVEIQSENPLVAEVIVNDQPDCGESNGSVTILMQGGSGQYQFSWPSGTNTQDSLTAGLYSVTVTDMDSTMCELPLIFVLNDSVPLADISILDTLEVSCFGGNDGGIDFEINYDNSFVFPADTLISNGLGVFENGALSAGNYCLIIQDANACVAGSICFEVGQPAPLQLDVAAFPDCEDGGVLDVTVQGGTPPYNYNWSIIPDPTVEDPTGLAQGVYDVTITDMNGCELLVDALQVDSCILCDVWPSADSIVLQTVNCDTTISICLNIHNDVFFNFVITDNGVPYLNPFTQCGFDFTGTYTYAPLFGQGNSGPYNLVDWPVNGSSVTGTFDSMQELVDLMNQFDPSGNWELDEANLLIEGGVLGNTYGTMEVFVVNFGLTSFIGFNDQLVPNAFAIDLSVGFHEIVVTDTTTGCQDSIFATILCTTPDTLDIVIIENQSDTLCFGGDELFGSIDTIFNDCPDGTFVEYEIFEDSCIIFTGILEGFETACIVVCDSLNICDTTYVNITVLRDGPPDILDTILITQIEEICFDTMGLGLMTIVASIENLCPSQSGTFVDFVLNDTTNCLTYTGLEVGTDTACLEFCDSLGNCESFALIVTVVPGQTITDTVQLYVDTVTFCIDTTILDGTIISMEDICPEANGNEIAFFLDTINYCVTYTGVGVGVDTACIRLEDDLGNVWLTNFIITSLKTTPAIFCDTLFINEELNFCLDTFELPGTYIFQDEICPDLSTGNIFFSGDPDDPLCLVLRGESLGKDTACYIVCDDLGFCDTTYFCLLVKEFFDPPVAVHDTLCPPNDTSGTSMGTPIIIDVLGNDTVFGGLTHFEIIEQPRSLEAEVLIFLDNSVSYVPEPPHCDRTDEFTYVVCNPNGCDTATVCIYIHCVELRVFNAVSPNNDGFNDVFWIAKIEDFPNNTLRVYNRWGNMVYQAQPYRNDWPATWDKDKDLPDGTYFYILEWLDGEVLQQQRGHIEVFR